MILTKDKEMEFYLTVIIQLHMKVNGKMDFQMEKVVLMILVEERLNANLSMGCLKK
jgi:hypothetical protein